MAPLSRLARPVQVDRPREGTGVLDWEVTVGTGLSSVGRDSAETWNWSSATRSWSLVVRAHG